MGTLLRVEAEASPADEASEAIEAVVRDIEGLDALLSTWDPRTPLSRANQAPVGEPAPVPPQLLAVLVEAEAWVRRTGGAFDPAVGALVDAWDLRGHGRTPGTAALASALEAVGWGGITIDPVSGTITRHAEAAWVDTGAFGKGAALRTAAHTLRQGPVHRALLDLGGQILAYDASAEAPWEVAVAHPTHRHQPLHWLRLANVSAATSGNSERGIDVEGQRLSHILDPRTGHPAPDWGSVTVVTADPLVADILSTALYVMGPTDGLAWAATLPDVGVLFLVRTGAEIQTLHNQAMKQWLVPSPAGAGVDQTSSPEGRTP